MAEALILEFTGVGRAEYDAVNGKLGIDMDSGSGDWPAGLLMHAAGTSERGTLVVAEVWDTREAQDAFMRERLGEALAAGGVTSRPNVSWMPLFAFHTPGS